MYRGHGKGKVDRMGRSAERKAKNEARKAARQAKKLCKPNCSDDEEELLADFFGMYEEDEIDFIAEFLFDSYDEDSYDDEEDYSESEDYYSYN